MSQILWLFRIFFLKKIQSAKKHIPKMKLVLRFGHKQADMCTHYSWFRLSCFFTYRIGCSFAAWLRIGKRQTFASSNTHTHTILNEYCTSNCNTHTLHTSNLFDKPFILSLILAPVHFRFGSVRLVRYVGFGSSFQHFCSMRAYFVHCSFILLGYIAHIPPCTYQTIPKI